MSNRKPRRLSIEGGIVIASDGNRHGFMPGATVVCEDDTIVYVGYDRTQTADERVDARGRLVMPGMINLEVCSYVDIQGFLTDNGHPNYLGPSGFNFAPRRDWLGRQTTRYTESEARNCAAYGLMQAVQGGATTIVATDYGGVHPDYADMLVDAADAIGLRAFLAKSFGAAVHYVTEQGGGEYHWDDEEGTKGLQRSLDFALHLRRRRADRPNSDVTGMLFPYRADAMNESLLRQTRAAADENGVRIRMHASQFLTEFYEQIRRTSQTPIEFLHGIGFLKPDVLLHHAILCTGHSWIARSAGQDVQILAESGVGVGHCPTIFARRAVMLESFSKYLAAGVNMGLGTDTVPQDMLMVMRWAASLSKIADRNVTSGAAAEVFHAATIGGANALGRNDLGRICVGAKADMLIVQVDSLRSGPIDDPLRNLVNCCTSADIESVWIGGRKVTDHGQVIGQDAETVMPTMTKMLEDKRQHFVRIAQSKQVGLDLFQPSLPTWNQVPKPETQVDTSR